MNENQDLLHRKWYQELWNKWDIGVADELFTTDAQHGRPRPAAAAGSHPGARPGALTARILCS